MQKAFIRHNSWLPIVALWALFTACQPQETLKDKAQAIVDAAIAAHGGAAYNQLHIAFTFRDRDYVVYRNQGAFRYERLFTREDDSARVADLLTNEGFERRVNGELVALPAKDSLAYANSVNSVVYFLLLPYFLNDPAVYKTYLGEVTLKGEPYEKVQVTFSEDGGGVDHEDVYIYWFHATRHTLDYLAYSFLVNNGGARFREAIQPRVVSGVLFLDYINYKPTSETYALATLDSLFEAGQLEVLSRIENLEIRPVQNP